MPTTLPQFGKGTARPSKSTFLPASRLFCRRHRHRGFLRAFLHGPDIALRTDEERTVGGHRCLVGCGAQSNLGDHFHFLARGEDDELLLRIDVNFAVGDQRRAPGIGMGLIDPVGFARLFIEAMDVAGEVGGVEQSVTDGDAGDGALESVVGPNAAALGDVARLRRVDAVQHATPASVRRILADGAIDTPPREIPARR